MEKPPTAVTSAKQARKYGQLVSEDSTLPASSRLPTCCCPYGWTVWTVLTIGQITTFFGTSSGVAFVIEGVMAELELSRSLVSLAYAVGTFIGAAAQIPIGRAVDRFGGRRGVAICSAAFYIALIGMSLPHNWYALTLAFAAMRALGFGGLALACNTCLQNWFVRRRGLATGLSESINTLVGFGFCAQLYSMAVLHFGWRHSYVLVGSALLLYSPIAYLLLRSRPEEVSLLPDGDQVDSAAGTANAAAAAGAPAAAAGGARALSAKPPAVTGWRLSEAARTSALWIIVAANALQWGIGAGFFFEHCF